MKTKKNYITPEICEYDILTAAMICQSAVSAGGDDYYVDEVDENQDAIIIYDTILALYFKDFKNFFDHIARQPANIFQLNL